VTGQLAESISLDPSKTALTVTLRPLKSQTGNTLSAEDVRWSFVDYANAVQPVLGKTFAIAGFDAEHLVTVVDPHTVKLNIKQWNSYSDAMLQNSLAYVYDSTEAMKHATQADPVAQQWLSTHLADYSGWVLEQFTPGQSVTVTALPDWGGPQRAISRLVVQAAPNDSTRQQLIASGQAQLANGFQYDQYKSLSGSSGVTVLSCPGLNMDTLMLSNKEAPLNDVRVRQAISMAINRDQIVTGAYFGYATPAKSSFNASFGLTTTGDAYKYDPNQAKSLLAAAGYPNGFDLTLSYSPTRPGPVAQRTAVLLQSMLKNVGINVNLREVASPTDFSTAVLGGSYQSVLYGEPAVIADPAYLAWVKFGSNAPNNTTGWSSPDFDKQRAQLAATPTTDATQRTQLLQQLATMGDTQLPIVYLAETPNLVATNGINTAPPLTNGQILWAGIGG
jgi:peptide/nickel transport system substrate-binding protein